MASGTWCHLGEEQSRSTDRRRLLWNKKERDGRWDRGVGVGGAVRYFSGRRRPTSKRPSSCLTSFYLPVFHLPHSSACLIPSCSFLYSSSSFVPPYVSFFRQNSLWSHLISAPPPTPSSPTLRCSALSHKVWMAAVFFFFLHSVQNQRDGRVIILCYFFFSMFDIILKIKSCTVPALVVIILRGASGTALIFWFVCLFFRW